MVGNSLGANSAYWTTWGFNEHALAGGADTVTSYTYNGNGGNQPHTLTSTTTVGGSTSSASFTYDAAGNMATRAAGSGNQTMQWDDANRLTAVNGGVSGNTSFVYDADGNVLLQKDPGKTILYLPGEQITLDTAAQTLSGVRNPPHGLPTTVGHIRRNRRYRRRTTLIQITQAYSHSPRTPLHSPTSRTSNTPPSPTGTVMLRSVGVRR